MDQKMNSFNIRSFRQSDTEAVVQLWKACGLVTRTNDPLADIQRKLRVDPQWFLVGLLDHQLVATCMAGYEGHRGWINYLAVAPRFRRRGFATCLMAEAERRLAAAGCPKINLQVRDTNTEVLRFYRRIGFVQDPVVSLGKRLIQDKV
jgi:ribosomal protein S18 acetylase RimI-like enzyme